MPARRAAAAAAAMRPPTVPCTASRPVHRPTLALRGRRLGACRRPTCAHRGSRSTRPWRLGPGARTSARTRASAPWPCIAINVIAIARILHHMLLLIPFILLLHIATTLGAARVPAVAAAVLVHAVHLIILRAGGHGPRVSGFRARAPPPPHTFGSLAPRAGAAGGADSPGCSVRPHSRRRGHRHTGRQQGRNGCDRRARYRGEATRDQVGRGPQQRRARVHWHQRASAHRH